MGIYLVLFTVQSKLLPDVLHKNAINLNVNDVLIEMYTCKQAVDCALIYHFTNNSGILSDTVVRYVVAHVRNSGNRTQLQLNVLPVSKPELTKVIVTVKS